MAQLIGQQELDENGKPKNQAQPVAGPSPITQPTSSGGAPSAAPSQQPATPKGTGFTDIGKIKRANVGADVGLAKAATKDISQTAQSGMQKLGDVWKSYSSRIQGQQVAPLNKQRIQDLTSKAASGSSLSPEEQKEITQYTQFQYKGPTSLEGADANELAAQQAAARDAQSKALASLSTQGRRDLLTNVAQGQAYTPGMSRLDELFLGGKGARGVLGQLRGQTAGFEREAGGLGSKVEQAAQAAKAAGEAADIEATGIVKSAQSGITKTAEQRMQEAAKSEAGKAEAAGAFQGVLSKGLSNLSTSERKNALNNAVASGIISQADAEMMEDVSGNPEVAALVGDTLSKALGGSYTAGQLGGSVQDYYTGEDVSKLSGLESLLGGSTKFEAGKGSTLGSFALDKGALGKALSGLISPEVQGQVAAENEAKELEQRALQAEKKAQQIGMQTHANTAALAPGMQYASGGLSTGMYSPIQTEETKALMSEAAKARETANQRRQLAAQKQARTQALNKLASKYNLR